jgi:hypothetical protein
VTVNSGSIPNNEHNIWHHNLPTAGAKEMTNEDTFWLGAEEKSEYAH